MQPEIQQLMLSKLESLTLEINSLRELITQGKPEPVTKGGKNPPKVARLRECKSKKDFKSYFEQKYK